MGRRRRRRRTRFRNFVTGVKLYIGPVFPRERREGVGGSGWAFFALSSMNFFFVLCSVAASERLS